MERSSLSNLEIQLGQTFLEITKLTKINWEGKKSTYAISFLVTLINVLKRNLIKKTYINI